MARLRTIKPEFFFNEGLATLSDRTRLFFIGLWCQADRMGRMEDRPGRLRANIFPYDSSVNAEELIAELTQMGHLIRYEVDGVKVLEISNFLKHQRPHRKEAPSILPGRGQGKDGESAVQGQGKQRESPLDNGEWRMDNGVRRLDAKRQAFTPPTMEELQAYCKERGGKVDPDRWMAHYQSNGWKVGRNPMKDWRAAVRTWEKSSFGPQPARVVGGAAPVKGKYDHLEGPK